MIPKSTAYAIVRDGVVIAKGSKAACERMRKHAKGFAGKWEIWLTSARPGERAGSASA